MLDFETLKAAMQRSARLLGNQDGVSLIEFALALPLLLIVALGGLEFSNYVVAHQRVRQLAAMAADNASRLRTQMSEAYVNQLFVGVEKAGQVLEFKNKGRLILSSVQNNASGTGQWIRWQRCFGQLSVPSKYGAEDAGKNGGSLPSISGLQAQPSSAIMYAEVTYDYEPLFPNRFTADTRITHEIAFIVRQRTDFGIAGPNPSRC